MDVDDLRPIELFRGLTDAQLAELIRRGEEVRIEPGVELFSQGEPADDWWVVIDGALELHRRMGREDAVVGRMDVPGRWAGGIRAWDEHSGYLATARGVAPGRVLRVSSQVLREWTDAQFPFGAHIIEGLFKTVRMIESTARQRESLVTLGTLSAGLAHELNNPAAAATRAVASLADSCETLVSSLGNLVRKQLSVEEFEALDDLRRELRSSDARVDALEMADREDALTDWLAEHAVDRDWVIAPALAASGADVAWCERVAGAVDARALGPALEWVASTLASATLLGEVKESTRRISELVAAMSSYSQMDRASRQRIDVTEGLESTLVMLGHKVRDGVEVVRSYGADVPRIDAYPGELNQVWTNLIDNALDAMDGGGTLRLTTRAAPDAVIIEIADSGAGMPREVAERAFDAFFTTKDVGKGTGLGLDIARRIVEERHGGTIDIASEPGNTVLRVTLPAQAPQP